MSAVFDTPTLPGIPEAPVVQTSERPAPQARDPAAAAAADTAEPLKCCFIGHLVAPALVRTVGTESVVEVLLHQRVPRHPQALPLFAVWHYPDHLGDPLEAHRRAQALAARLPEGAECTVLGRGLETSHHQGEPVLHVLHVLGLKPTEPL